MSITAALQSFVTANALAGAVTLVASPTKVLGQENVGFCDRERRLPMRADNLFWIASTSKPLTAIALMMLVDEGKVDVTAPVATYLPEYEGQELAVAVSEGQTMLRKPARPITVADVLSHTSGLPFMSRLEKGKIDTMTLKEACISYAMTPLQSEPGTTYSYSNAGTNTAGRIIEVASGLSYEAFMQSRLLSPLGMKDTTFRPNAAQLTRLAKAYKPNAANDDLVETDISQLTLPFDNPRRGPCPAGGYFSTAADLSQLGRMLLNGGTLDGRTYLSPAAIATMTRKQTGPLVDAQYGFCFGLDAATGNYGHGGALSNDFTIDVKHQLCLIFLVQHAGFAGPDGAKINPAFKAAAIQAYAGQSRSART